MKGQDPTMESAVRRPFRFSFAPTIAAEGRFAPERTAALEAFLERALGRAVEIVPSPGYDAALAALADGRLDAAMLGEVASRYGEEVGGVVPLVAPAGGGLADPTYQ